MLAADKLQLQSHLKQQATALKEKEFQLHHSNLMTVGTQAAVLAALDVTLFIEFHSPPDEEWSHLLDYSPWLILIPRVLRFIYFPLIVAALCLNVLVVANTTTLSIAGTSLALRGPDGSMMVATDGLYVERQSIFAAFHIGLWLTMASVVVCVWLFLNWEASFVCMVITIITGRKIYLFQQRINERFFFDESQTVDFNDLFEAGSNMVVPMKNSIRNFVSGNTSRHPHGSQTNERFSEHGIGSRNSTPEKRSFISSQGKDVEMGGWRGRR